MTLAYDARLYLDDVARVCEVARSTVSTYRARGLPAHNPFPEPDGYVISPLGHRRPWWYWVTIAEWLERRPLASMRRGDA